MTLSDRVPEAQREAWNVDRVADGAPGARHTVQIAPSGGLNVTMHLEDTGRRPAAVAAEAALLSLLRDTFGEHAALVELIDLSALRFTFGRHPNGEVTVWVKVPPPKGLPDRAGQEVARKFIDAICRRGPRKQPTVTKGVPVDVGIEWADCQFGKGTVEAFGTGPEETVERLSWFIDHGIPAELARLKAQGYAVASAELGLTGDGTEGVSGSYDNQTHTVKLNAAEQLEAFTGIIDRMVEKLVDLRVPEIRGTGVASNHDQMSRGSGRKNITDDWDDRTFTVLRTLGRAYTKNADRYGNQVRIEMPADPNVACVETSLGLPVARIHGHIPKVGGAIPTGMWKWWDGQRASGMPGAGGARLLTVSHYHHPYAVQQQGRTLYGNPSTDNGSRYLLDMTGRWSTPGLRVWFYDGSDLWSKVLVSPADREREAELIGRNT